MFRVLGIVIGCILFSTQAFAIPCFMTMVKGKCWKNYTVEIDVLDAENNQLLMHVSIPKGKMWERQSFESRPKQRLMLRATFSPSFWERESAGEYYAKRYWSLPEKVKGEIAWHVGACFPNDFSGVPLPPDAGSDCECDTREIPQVGTN